MITTFGGGGGVAGRRPIADRSGTPSATAGNRNRRSERSNEEKGMGPEACGVKTGEHGAGPAAAKAMS